MHAYDFKTCVKYFWNELLRYVLQEKDEESEAKIKDQLCQYVEICECGFNLYMCVCVTKTI